MVTQSSMSEKTNKSAQTKATNPKLPPRHRKFADEYLISKNATAAYLAAGYKCKSPEIAAASASRLLTTAKVSAYLAEKARVVGEKAELDATEVLNEARRLATSDFRKLFDPDGNMKPIAEIDDDTAACVASVEVDELFDGRGEKRVMIGYTKKIKLWDKNAALDKLMRHLALYKDPGSKEVPINHTMTVIFKDAE